MMLLWSSLTKISKGYTEVRGCMKIAKTVLLVGKLQYSSRESFMDASQAIGWRAKLSAHQDASGTR